MAFASRLPWKEKLFFGAPIAVTFSLGVWQLFRLDQKNHLIHQRQDRLNSPPLQLSDLAADSAISDLEYRRIVMSGQFRHDDEVLIGPRPAPTSLSDSILQWAGTTGFLVVTPLAVDDDSKTGILPLLVRGWIPQRLSDPSTRESVSVKPLRQSSALRHAASVSTDEPSLREPGLNGAERIVAIVKPQSEIRNRFTPDNNPGKGEWYYIDAKHIANSLRERPVSGRPILFELLEGGTAAGWPFPKSEEDHMTFRTPPSTHIIYAVTWFSLCTTLSILTRSRFLARPQ